MMQYIVPATGLLFTLENILWINIGVFVGSVFAAIPGLSVILCVILFLPVTYTCLLYTSHHLVRRGKNPPSSQIVGRNHILRP